MAYPYSYYRCPCADESSAEGDHGLESSQHAEERQERTFDPRSPRSSFSLYPLDHLMWCEDCHDIRCPRCTIEEIVTWYCPSCLFEVPSSMVKSEGNRCNRNCFNCPSCTAPLSVTTLDTEAGGAAGPWILACEYCNWTTLDIGVQLEKPTNISGQLSKLKSKRSRYTQLEPSDGAEEVAQSPKNPDFDSHFNSLKGFYRSQLSNANSAHPLMSPAGELNYGSPNSLSRIMSLYTGMGYYGKKSAAKASMVREAAEIGEGLAVIDPVAEAESISKLRTSGLGGTTNPEQRDTQILPCRFLSELQPIPTLLRTKRSRRCRTCRHILVKPDSKVHSTRYRIKLIALNYVPSMQIKLLPSGSISNNDLSTLPPSRPLQFLLTLQNPMFDPVKITLATPAMTPGRFGSRVTILCPQFDIGANTDVWDEALGGDVTSSAVPGKGKASEAAEGKVAEAGKIWERGRNWTTVVLEVVCARIDVKDEYSEDDDILEIPVFVRAEYEVDVAGEEAGNSSTGKEKKEKRELACWTVLGVGKIARSVS